jgi:outer membrane protein insertion porin family
MKRLPETLALVLLPALALAQAQIDIGPLLAEQGRTIEAIGFEGINVTKEHIVTREIHSKVGDPLDVAAVVADDQRLHNLQIFSQVDIKLEAGSHGGVRLTFVVKEMNSWLPTLAVKFTEQDGFSAGPGLSALNLTGRNIRLSGAAIFGGTTQFWADFTWPWITGHHVGVEGRGAHLERFDTLNEFQETSNELRLLPSRFLGQRGRLGGLVQLLTVASDRPGKTLSPTNEDLLVSLGVSIGWDTRDAWNNPRGGWLNEVQVSKTGGALGGDADFWSLIVDLRRWQPTFGRQRLMLSGLMSLQSGEVGVDIPEYAQYRLGGANTIRGYDVEKLGRELFGRNQLLGTVEYSFRVVPPRLFSIWKLNFRLGLELALLGDVGVAWNESHELNSRRTRAGLGAGVRLLVPGSDMVRVDVGWSPEGGFRIHLAGGTKPERQRDRLR